MSENAMDGKDEAVNREVERIENERMTRRKALRKFGFTAGMAVFSVLTVDDLARIASKKLQDTEATKGIGDMLAKEFRSAGVAMANPYGGDPYGNNNPSNPYGRTCEEVCMDVFIACGQDAANTYGYGTPDYTAAAAICISDRDACLDDYCGGGGGPSGGGGNPYGSGCENADNCTDCCQQAKIARDAQCAANADPTCIQNGYPAGDPSCVSYNICMAASIDAQTNCESYCTGTG